VYTLPSMTKEPYSASTVTAAVVVRARSAVGMWRIMLISFAPLVWGALFGGVVGFTLWVRKEPGSVPPPTPI
jgi:hypothetical protein